MLTKEDLGQIREVVHEVVSPIVLASEKRVTKTIIEAVGEMINDNIVPQLDCIYEDVGELKKDVKVLKQDVSVLKQDVTVLKKDVTFLKEDVSQLKQDMTEVKQEVRTINAKMITKGGLEDRLTDFRLSFSGTAV